MRSIFAFCLLAVAGCCRVARQPESQETAPLTTAQANRFLDSIHAVDPRQWAEAAQIMPDSVFRSQQRMDIQLSPADFKAIHDQAKNGKLDLRLFNLFALQEKLEKEQISDTAVWVTLYEFKGTEQFAVELYSLGWESNTYFFDRNKVVAKHHIYHRYGLKIESFSDGGETVIYYKQNFTSGAGVWWFNFNFYRYSAGQLIPALDLLENANMAYPNDYRTIYFEASVETTSPLTFKMIFQTELSRPQGYETDTLERDSTFVKYTWNNDSSSYEPDFSNTKLDRGKILSFYLQENELLYVHTHYQLLKSIVNGKAGEKQKSVLKYLAEVRKNAAQLNEINDWIR